jgi:hypothetical protein
MCDDTGGTGRDSGTTRTDPTTRRTGASPAAVTVFEAQESLADALRILSELEVRSLTAAERLDLLGRLHSGSNALHGHFLTALAYAESYQDAQVLGHGTVTAMLADRLRLAPALARQAVREARTLRDHPATRAALCSGSISAAHVTQIVTGLRAVAPSSGWQSGRSDDLPGSATPPAFTKAATAGGTTSATGITTGIRTAIKAPAATAEQILLDLSGSASAREVRLAVQQLRHTIDPTRAEREFSKAQDQSTCYLSQSLDGRWHLEATLDPESGALVQGALAALIGERLRGRQRADLPGGLSSELPTADAPMPRRRAQALTQLAVHLLDSGSLDHHGGVRPHLTVTVPLEVLLGLPGAGSTEWGDALPGSAVRRLACDARITRIVLDPAGQPLNVGRTSRLATAAQRRALEVRDGGCRFSGCDRPAGWCDAHHLVSWLDGGPTDLDNLVLVCRAHHALLHRAGSPDPDWMAPTPGGRAMAHGGRYD